MVNRVAVTELGFHCQLYGDLLDVPEGLVLLRAGDLEVGEAGMLRLGILLWLRRRQVSRRRAV